MPCGSSTNIVLASAPCGDRDVATALGAKGHKMETDNRIHPREDAKTFTHDIRATATTQRVTKTPAVCFFQARVPGPEYEVIRRLLVRKP